MVNLEFIINEIEQLITLFRPIELDRLEQAALPKRVDTKFIFPISLLGNILQQTTDDYYILLVAKNGLQKYHTLYFDTSDHQFYFAHHNGKLNRYKIRIRKYVNSDFCCLEVKFKNNLSQTVKKRLPIPELCHELTHLASLENVQTFMRQTFPCHYTDLQPKLLNDFQRITLVHKHNIERVTIDISLRFGRPMSNNLDFQTLAPGLALIEIKQERFSIRSHFLQQMRTAHININPTSFSKYCTGMALLNPHLKANNFKPIFLHAQKVASQPTLFNRNNL